MADNKDIITVACPNCKEEYRDIDFTVKRSADICKCDNLFFTLVDNSLRVYYTSIRPNIGGIYTDYSTPEDFSKKV